MSHVFEKKSLKFSHLEKLKINKWKLRNFVINLKSIFQKNEIFLFQQVEKLQEKNQKGPWLKAYIFDI